MPACLCDIAPADATALEDDQGTITDAALAGYIAKYATKGRVRYLDPDGERGKGFPDRGKRQADLFLAEVEAAKNQGRTSTRRRGGLPSRPTRTSGSPGRRSRAPPGATCRPSCGQQTYPYLGKYELRAITATVIRGWLRWMQERKTAASYRVVRTLAHRPAGLEVVFAASLPLTALRALQALRAVGTQDGDTVLVHTAAGGVGHLAVQVTRALARRGWSTRQAARSASRSGWARPPIPVGAVSRRRIPAIVGTWSGG